jgi:predicted DNA-binding protein YlxM (UPF0122 family)
MMLLTEEQEKQIFEMGKLGFSFKEIAINFDLPIQEVASQFALEKGNVFTAWKKGNIQAMYELRDTIMKSALNSSSPHVKEMLQILGKVDKLNEDADESI